MSGGAAERATPSVPTEKGWEDRAEDFAEASARVSIAWRATVDASITGAIAAAAGDAASRHHALAAAAGLGAAEGMAPGEVWARFAAYRARVVEEVLQPFLGGLSRIAPARSLTESVVEAMRGLEAGLSAFGRVETWPDPSGLYAPDPADNGWVRSAKRWVRARRAIGALPLAVRNAGRRMLRRDPLPPPSWQRSLPAEHLARYHLRVRVAVGFEAAHTVMQRQVAQEVGTYLAACSAWIESVLDLELRLDRPEFHAPDEWDFTSPSLDSAEEPPLEAEAFGFVDRLQAALAAPPAASDRDAEGVPSEADGEALRDDLRRGGTALLPLRRRFIPEWEQSTGGRLAAAGAQWARWHERARTGVGIAAQRITMRIALVDLFEALLRRLGDAVMRPVGSSFDVIHEKLRTMATHAAEACDAGLPLDALASRLADLEASGVQAVAAGVGDLQGLASAEVNLTQVGTLEQREVERLTAQLPEEVRVVAPPDNGTIPDPRDPGVTLYPREAAADTFTPPLSTLLREPADALRKRVLETWEATDRVVHIVEYNLESAAEELTTARRAQGGRDEADARQRARELAEDGFRRAAETLAEQGAALQGPWEAFVRAVFQIMHDDWIEFHRRVRGRAEGSDRVEETRTRVRRRLRRGWVEARERFRRDWVVTRPRLAALWGRATHLLSRGRAAIGTERASDAERLQTLDAIAEVDRKVQDLPLVYRRLFSRQPIRRRQLLAGRAQVLATLRDFIARWEEGNPAATMVITGLPGSGRTSVLDVLAAELAEGSDVEVRRVTLAGRLHDDREAAVAFGRGLEVEAESWTDLVERLEEGPPRATVCLVDGLEFLFSQRLAGTLLADHAIEMFRATESRVCWVVTASQVMWPILQSASRPARGLRTLSLESLDRQAFEAAILLRHQWSGLPLRLATPDDLSPLLRRRLRRAHTPEAEQRILQDVFLDRLYRASLGDTGLALLYWLQAADFEAVEGAVTLRPIVPFQYRFLDYLSLAHTMMLRAILAHGALSVAGHEEIFRVPAEQSVFLLEHLYDLGLLEPAEGEPGPPDATVQPGRAYRIRQALRPAVIRHLRNANMLPRSAA